MKKSVLIGILVLFLAALLTAGSWAWFTHTAEPVVNKLTAGTVKIEIDEHGFTDIDNWNPGAVTDKKVSVKTLGSKCVYVRVSLTPVWGYLEGETFVAEPGLPIDLVVLNTNTGDEDDWVFADGWYYYKKILCPADVETSLLLQSVTLSGDTDDRYQGKALRIVVNAEAVQASHGAYKDAWGLADLPSGVQEWTEPAP